MNLLGRLFIVLIFVGSVMFMSLSVALYATHTNWRDQATKQQEDLENTKKELAELNRQKSAMETALNLEIRSQVNRNVALKERVDQLSQADRVLRDELAQKNAQLDEQTALAKSAITETEQLRIRFTTANEALLIANNEWMNMSTELIRKTDEAHALAIQVTNYEMISAQLAKDYRDAVEVLIKLGVDSTDPALYASHPPSGIQGTVTDIRPGGVVEISIGLDSGLVKGHQVDVVRSRDGHSTYIGKIELTNVVADRAIARVMPEFRRGVVLRGDDVIYIDVNEIVAH